VTFKKGQSGNPGGKWKAGQSGNPSGRPKSKPFKDALEAIIKEVGLNKAAAALVAKANTGDVAALKEVADRLDGKVATEVGGSDQLGPIRITWMDDLDGNDKE
jgi:hypothetical protein